MAQQLPEPAIEARLHSMEVYARIDCSVNRKTKKIRTKRRKAEDDTEGPRNRFCRMFQSFAAEEEEEGHKMDFCRSLLEHQGAPCAFWLRAHLIVQAMKTNIELNREERRQSPSCVAF